MNITLDDGRTELWQWDTGRKIVVDDKSVSEVHYSKYSSTQAITREVINGKAEIPNFLLQDTHAVTAYAYSGSIENGYTMAEKTFNVVKKPKPANYVETEEDKAILAKLKAAIGDLSELQTEAKYNLVTAINEVAENAEAASTHVPQISANKTWLVWDANKGGYVDTGVSAAGEILEVDDTLTQPGQAADAAAVGERLSALSEEIVTTSESKVAAHNSGTDTHSDIRGLIQGLTDRLNALADSDDTTLDQLSEVVAYIKSNRELIAAITTDKVSAADIVDNLTTNVSNKPLSAAQGVVIKTLIDALRNDKLDASELTNAINTALAQAKASGEFDGADGKSAYAYAVDGGYTGTEEEFAEKLAAEIPAVDATLTQSGKAADSKAVGDALDGKEAAYQPDLPEGYIYVQEIPENADTSKIYVLPDGYAYAYSEHTVVEKHNANTGLVNIKPDTNANYQSLSAQSGVLTSDLIPFSADWVPTTADRANSTIKVSGIAKLVPAYFNSSIIVYLYYADGSWMGTARTSQIDSLGNPALGSEVSVPVEWYLKDTNSAGVVGGWENVGYVRVLLGISTSGDITAEDAANVVINVPFYDAEQVVTGWARNGEKFAISFSDAVGQNTRDIDALDVRVSALEKSGGEEITVQTNQILYAVGDSITYGYGVGGNSGSWVRHVIDLNGYDATNSRNLGESGLGFCTASTSNHTVHDIVGSTDFSGADIVTVALGINDWKNYNALLTDVWSGMEYVFGKIRTDNPYCKIYFIVPFNVSIATSAYATFYGLGYAGDNNKLRPYAHTLLEFIGMLKARFAMPPLNGYNVQIIDLTEGVAINRQNIKTALIDNLHPTASTHSVLGKVIAPMLRLNTSLSQTAAQVQTTVDTALAAIPSAESEAF